VTVFVSYSSRDRGAVKSLTQDLQDADEQVWLDQRLAGGDAWWRAILEQIRGCDVLIFALSQNSIESKPCQAELHYAQALRLPILPVQVGPVDSMQLNPLATVQTVDYRSPTPSTAMRLLVALNRTRAQRQPLPSPLPDEPEVPFEYLIRLYTTIGGPDYLSPPDQAALVAQLQFGLREDGDHEAARSDIVMLLSKLRDREDVTYRTRSDVEAILASIGLQSAMPLSVANPALLTPAPEPAHLDDSRSATPLSSVANPLPPTEPAGNRVTAQRRTPKAASLASTKPALPQPSTPSPTKAGRISRRTTITLIVGAVVIAGVLAVAIPATLRHQSSHTARTPIAEIALEGLLLSPDQINTAMGATGMTPPGGASTPRCPTTAPTCRTRPAYPWPPRRKRWTMPAAGRAPCAGKRSASPATLWLMTSVRLWCCFRPRMMRARSLPPPPNAGRPAPTGSSPSLRPANPFGF
jgi:serine/threonine kinase PknH